MTSPDLLIYAVHAAFWIAFGITRFVTARDAARMAAASPQTNEANNAPPTAAPTSVPFAKAAVAFHMVAFGVMYFGIGMTVLPNQVPQWFEWQRVAGALVIAEGAFLACWAVAHFHSWRFQAKLDAGHQLATGGPFRYFRHPIYMALNLLAIGSAIWVPTPMLWAGAVLMWVGSELRARIEERLLTQAFGAAYTDYCARTRRFIPGVY